MIAALRTSTAYVVLMVSIVGCSSERAEPQPTTPTARVLSLWEGIPPAEKTEHSMQFFGARYLTIVADYQSSSGREYRVIVDEIRPSAGEKWQAFEAMDFAEPDQCGNPSAPVNEEVFNLHGGDLLSTLPDSIISRPAMDEFLICPAQPRLGCRALFSTDQFIVGTIVSRRDMCDWSALRAEIQGQVDLWFSEQE